MSRVDYIYDIPRHDTYLIAAVEQLGEDAYHSSATQLRIIEIPAAYANCYKITQYDGFEKVICKPKALVEYRLKQINTDTITDSECKELLIQMINILNSPVKTRYL